MTLLLKQIFALIKMLNSETGTKQIAAGMALGLVLGMSPFLSLQTFLVLVIVLVFRVQMGAAFLSAFFFKFVAYLLDPLSDQIGEIILTHPSLQATWTSLYNMPLIPLTRFNNTMVMGSGVLAFALFPVLFFVTIKMIEKYRETILKRFQNSKIWKVVKATSLYQWYYKYDQLYG